MANSPYFIGDSIAEGLRSAAGGQGDTKVGRSPSEVLRAINSGPNLAGQSVVLSTGLSNNPNDVATAAAQIRALKAKGAGNISVVGLGDRFSNLNPVVQQFAQSQGANFTGGFAAGGDGVHPKSYSSMLSSVYPQSDLGGAPVQPAAPGYAPSQLGGVTPGVGTPGVAPVAPSTASTGAYTPSSLVAATSGAILHHESGSTPGKLNNPTSPAGARGPGQIMPATFRQYARPGESINNPADNLAVHNRIMADYARRWPNDPARWAVAYFSGPGNVAPPGSPTPWIRNSSDGHNTVSQYVANTAGKVGKVPSNGTVATTPGTTVNTSAAAQPSPDWGLAFASLGQGQGGQPSTLDRAQQAFGGGGQQEQPPPQNLQGEQAAAVGNVRQMQIAQQAQALAAALAQPRPLTWSSAPFGSATGQQTPGTTLNSMGA